MAPTRKSRSVNKRFSNFNEVSSDKEAGNLSKSRQRVSPSNHMLEFFFLESIETIVQSLYIQLFIYWSFWQKRKLSDMLGSQWSKGELQRFYDAYRKYGKDWKKVCHMLS